MEPGILESGPVEDLDHVLAVGESLDGCCEPLVRGLPPVDGLALVILAAHPLDPLHVDVVEEADDGVLGLRQLCDDDLASGCEDPVHLGDRTEDVRDVPEHVSGGDEVECVVVVGEFECIPLFPLDLHGEVQFRLFLLGELQHRGCEVQSDDCGSRSCSPGNVECDLPCTGSDIEAFLPLDVSRLPHHELVPPLDHSHGHDLVHLVVAAGDLGEYILDVLLLTLELRSRLELFLCHLKSP